MAKCPLCDEEINSLYLSKFISAVVEVSYNASYNQENSSLELTEMPERNETDERDILEEIYYCPVCNGEVAKSGDEALELLKGGEN